MSHYLFIFWLEYIIPTSPRTIIANIASMHHANNAHHEREEIQRILICSLLILMTDNWKAYMLIMFYFTGRDVPLFEGYFANIILLLKFCLSFFPFASKFVLMRLKSSLTRRKKSPGIGSSFCPQRGIGIQILWSGKGEA